MERLACARITCICRSWYGRLSTTDKQDASLSFPSQRKECAKKVEELGGEIVCEFTDEEAGRRDDRAGWSQLVREAKSPPRGASTR